MNADQKSTASNGAPDLRCSVWAREQRLDPIGSVGSYDGYLLITIPLPWPNDIGASSVVANLYDLAKESRVRIQALACAPDSVRRTVIFYRRRDAMSTAGGFQRSSWSGDEADVVVQATALLSGTLDSGVVPDQAGRDLLVCSHGSRDRCCGSRGTKLSLALASHSDGLPDGRTIWRTSHTGGHRFAPTALVFPEATAWAYLDEHLIASIDQRKGDLEKVVGSYRGYAGLDSANAQAIEREVLLEVGWDLFDMARWSESDGDVLRVFARESSGITSAWEGIVGTRRELSIPNCGRPVEESIKKERELEVLRFRRVL